MALNKRTLIECECGSLRQPGHLVDDKQWTFWCKTCKTWFFVPEWLVTKETVEEWIHIMAIKRISDENTSEGLQSPSSQLS